MASKTVEPKPQITIDQSGFGRFSKLAVQKYAIDTYPFVNLFYDSIGKRIALKRAKTESIGSFRIVFHNGRYMVFLRGLLNKAECSLMLGSFDIETEPGLLVLQIGKTKKSGPFINLPCRNSAGIPMASIDKRGTLIFDRHVTKAISSAHFGTIDVDYNPKKKEFTLNFSKTGARKVNFTDKHATVSFSGSLSRFGFKRPQQKLRFPCKVHGNQAIFKIPN
jgi:hypothetical protein